MMTVKRAAGVRSPEEKAMTLVGHPFAPIGRGEDLRCAARSARAAGIPVSIFDLDPEGRYSDQAMVEEFHPYLVDSFSSSTNVFFINGDEIGDVLERFPGAAGGETRQIISPQWELEEYPKPWAEEVDRFDEVWAPSAFVQSALEDAVTIPTYHMPLAVDVRLESFLPRRYFGLPESSFLFLFFFDFSAFMARKNPLAVIEVFERVCDRLGMKDLRLVVKTSMPWVEEGFRKEEREIKARIDASPHQERIVWIKGLMTDNEIKNLIRCCDCFLSLHRAEGFGRGLAEAMFLRKPVIGTGYSGNLDFMNADCAHVVDYSLVPVQKGQYPYARGQVWAQPDLDQAADQAVKVFRDPVSAREMGQAASREIRTYFSSRAIGLRYRARLEQLRG